MQSSDLKRVSGLWLKDGKKGKFMSGQTDAEIPAGAKLLVFKNDKKSSDKQPDYTLFAVETDGESNGQDRSDRHTSNGKARGQAPAHTASAAPTEDSIPF